MNPKFYLTTLLLCIFSTATVVGQQNDASYSYGNIPFNINLDSLEKATLKKQTTKALLKTYFSLEISRLSYISYKQGDAIDIIDSLCKIVNNKAAWATTALLKSKLSHKGKYNKAQCLVFAYNALPVFEALKDTTGILSVYSSLVNLNINIFTAGVNGDIKLIKYYMSVVERLSAASSKPVDKTYQFSLGSLYYRYVTNQPQVAIKYDKQGLALCQQYLPTLDFMQQTFLNALAIDLLAVGEQQKSIFYFQKALNYIEPTQSLVLPYIYNNLAGIYADQSEYTKAIFYQQQSISKAQTLEPHNYTIQSESYRDLSYYVFKVGNIEQAWQYRNIADSLKLLADSTDKNQELLELGAKYQTDIKEQQLLVVTKQKKQLQQLIIAGAIVIVIILSLAVLLLLSMQKLRSLNAFKEKVLSVISHDLQSPLLTLQDLNTQASYLLRTQQLHKFQHLAQMIDGASTQMSLLLNNLLLWALAKHNKKMLQTKPIQLYTAVNEVLALYINTAASKQVTISNTIPSNTIITANVQALQVILRNWVDNTLKYANAHLITISAVTTNAAIILNIADDGNIANDTLLRLQQQLASPSALTNETASGLGLNLMAYFSKILQWQLQLTHLPNGGNNFSVIIPQAAFSKA